MHEGEQDNEAQKPAWGIKESHYWSLSNDTQGVSNQSLNYWYETNDEMAFQARFLPLQLHHLSQWSWLQHLFPWTLPVLYQTLILYWLILSHAHHLVCVHVMVGQLVKVAVWKRKHQEFVNFYTTTAADAAVLTLKPFRK